MTKEKRKFPRIKVNKFYVETKLTDQKIVFNAEIVDLSVGGLNFIRKIVINKYDILYFVFKFKSQPMIMKGRIVRINGMETGVEFLNSEEELIQFTVLYNTEQAKFTSESGKVDKLVIPGYTAAPTREDIDKLLEID